MREPLGGVIHFVWVKLSINPYWLNDAEAEPHASASPFPLRRPLSPDLYLVPLRSPLGPEPDSEPRWLTDTLLFHFQRCSRRAFLDLYEDGSHRDQPSDYLLKLRRDSIAYRQAIFSEEPVQQPHYASGDWLIGASATLDLMAQGAERIAQGVLIVPGAAGFQLVSTPDLLIKRPGRSRFGNWLYVPADIKLGKRPKRDYQITAAFHAQVLALVQEAWPEESWLILRDNRYHAVKLEDFVPRMLEVLRDCLQSLQAADQKPEVFIAHNRCDLCHWFGYCYETAIAEQHLSLLPGVTPSRYAQLQKLKITDLETLAAASPSRLAILPGFGIQVAQKLVYQAQAVLHNRAIAHSLSEDDQFPLLPDDVPTRDVELYFDIEAAPEQNLVYLHGVLVVDRVNQTETFHPLLAETLEAEQQVWEDLLALLRRYPDAPVYHFCPYEAQTVQRLAAQYGTPQDEVVLLLERFVDLHHYVTQTVTLPVESYALKHIARWIGFEWRDSEANGAQSICWYDQWATTGDRAYLEAILRYNEDDCRATYHLKEWLVDFAQQFWQ